MPKRRKSQRLRKPGAAKAASNSKIYTCTCASRKKTSTQSTGDTEDQDAVIPPSSNPEIPVPADIRDEEPVDTDSIGPKTEEHGLTLAPMDILNQAVAKAEKELQAQLAAHHGPYERYIRGAIYGWDLGLAQSKFDNQGIDRTPQVKMEETD